MNLNEAKQKIENLYLSVETLYQEKATKIIQNELDLFYEKNKKHIKKVDNVYYYEGIAEISIINGCLQIITDKSLFLYLFEIDSPLHRGTIIEIDGEPIDVKNINNEKYITYVNRCIDNLEDSLNKLKSEGITDYTYCFDKMNLCRRNLSEVWEKVLENLD